MYNIQDSLKSFLILKYVILHTTELLKSISNFLYLHMKIEWQRYTQLQTLLKYS